METFALVLKEFYQLSVFSLHLFLLDVIRSLTWAVVVAGSRSSSDANADICLLVTSNQARTRSKTLFEKAIMVQSSGICFSSLGPVLVSTLILSLTSSRAG